jgi:citrate synthase
MSPPYLSAKQAANTLGVTLATLYAYTSRGQLRSEPVPGEPRARRYYRDDVERLKERKVARRDPAKAATRGLRWGEPVLESGITLIQDGAFYYRGQNALDLARSARAEDVAAWLWRAEDAERERLFAQPCPLDRAMFERLRRCTTEPIPLVQAALPIAAASDLASFDLRPIAVRQTGARILRLMTVAIAGRDTREPIHRLLHAAWAPKRASAADVIRAALVLCADHELNVSAFTARCAASAGATPYDVVAAAIASLKGFRHGGAGQLVLSLVRDSQTPAAARAALANRLRQGEKIPGFGHQLYPKGDPRAALLIELAGRSGNTASWRPFRNLVKAGAELLQEEPNLDTGLAAITHAYALPKQAPLLLFALGRTIGWIAHAMEEYASGHLIRPRARYTGPAPE